MSRTSYCLESYHLQELRIIGSFSRIVLVVLIALAALSTQKDQTLAQEKIRIAWSGVSPANSPIWVVQERGLLKEHGLTPRS